VVVLGRYIADFLAPSAKLIVEVDGSHHARRVSADARRDEALRRAGYRVLRRWGSRERGPGASAPGPAVLLRMSESDGPIGTTWGARVYFKCVQASRCACRSA
jgi:hypothetical protein